MEHPNDGERLLIRHLATRGIIVPRARVRGSIHRVDPENTAIRRSVTIRRRVYHVDGPNSLWHVDGHHKLIRWHMVIHGGIDGYSRTVVFLRCSDNNRASTVLTAFLSAVQRHGLPERLPWRGKCRCLAIHGGTACHDKCLSLFHVLTQLWRVLFHLGIIIL